MIKIDSIKLEEKVISEIKRISHKIKFSRNSHLFYQGQIPIVAYLLDKGVIQLIKNKKIKKILLPGSLIGLNSLMTNSPAKFEALVQAESILYYLDKSTIQEISNNEKSVLATLTQ